MSMNIPGFEISKIILKRPQMAKTLFHLFLIIKYIQFGRLDTKALFFIWLFVYVYQKALLKTMNMHSNEAAGSGCTSCVSRYLPGWSCCIGHRCNPDLSLPLSCILRGCILVLACSSCSPPDPKITCFFYAFYMFFFIVFT